MNEDLNKWFKEKWVNIGKKIDGKHPPCGTSGEKRGYAKCVPAAKAAGMSKKEKESATQRKRAAQNDAGRGGKSSSGQGKTPIYVSTKPKNETMNIEERINLFLEKNCPTDPGKWSASKSAAKSKFDVYPSAYANGWAAKNYKSKGGGWKTCSENVVSEVTGREAKEIAKLTGTCDSIVQKFIDDFNLNAQNLFNFIAKGKEKVRKDFATAMSGRPGNKYQGDFVGMFGEGIVNEACWEGYKQVGGKMKNGKMVPNCVPISEDIDSDDDVNYGLVEPEEYDVEDEDMEDFISFMRNYAKDLNEETCPCMHEAEYQGREVKLGKPMAGDVKKFKVYVKNPAGNVVKVNFGHGGTSAASKGEKTMRIRKSNPAARKSFRARHNCDSPGPRHKARYWSCRKW
jgi:hypothetical protein